MQTLQKKLSLIFLASLFTFGHPSTLEAKREPHFAKMHRKVLKTLNLSAEQKKQIKAVRKEKRESSKALREKAREARKNVQNKLNSNATDAEIWVAVEKLTSARAAVMKANLEKVLLIRKLLNSDQQRSYFEKIGKYIGKRAKFMHKKHPWNSEDL